MINFNYETDFQLEQESIIKTWISDVILNENYKVGEINYIFCTDDYLHKMNVEFLNHDTLTDVISFDYTVGKIIQGDIFISIDRVADNAKDFEVTFLKELYRVMVHGVLHFCGYKDKIEADVLEMRQKENQYLNLLG